LQLNIFGALNALNNKKISTQSISGDVETALILFSALANIDIDLELLVYKYFGDIPALILRKAIPNKSQSSKNSVHENEANKILESFRDISIRLDRLEHSLIN
jgi:ubiquinone biosynthesis protein UbiJ